MTAATRNTITTSRDGDLVVTVGRDAIGFVRRIGETYVAYGTGDEYYGRHKTQLAAVRALPAPRRRRAVGPKGGGAP